MLRTLGYLSPATYAASALRQTVLGGFGRSPLGIDLLALAAFGAVSLWIVGRRRIGGRDEPPPPIGGWARPCTAG